ncbi:expressed protein [Haematococcus lacustris]|uniref:Expressed protein n=1 Tax=Haematococcus lacustris TaxID=44745 RepID=A0A699ZM93_HAELA|nr:expressed protein [Haematococcus lacustris]
MLGCLCAEMAGQRMGRLMWESAHFATACPWSSRQRRALVKVRARKHVGELGADEPIAPFVEEAAAASHGLFDDSFKSALASTLSRNGTASLLEGQERLNDENRISAQEEVLRAAIMACRATLMKLQMIHQESEKAIELEKKQLERLQFALEKARNDAAYYRATLATPEPATRTAHAVGSA